jgi:curved DNA-binding protein CbpA
VRRLLILGLVSVQHPKPPGSRQAGLDDRIAQMVEQLDSLTHYEVLSVPTDAREDQIRSAYHQLAKEMHPDRFQSNLYSQEVRDRVERLFTAITGAYTTLMDPVARANYDEWRMRKASAVEAALVARSSEDLEKRRTAESLFVVGRGAFSRGEYQKAVDSLRECVWLFPDNARYHHFLGIAQSELPKYRKEAEEHFLRALQLEPTRIDSRLALGKLYLAVNLIRRAEAQLLEVLRWDPRHAEAQKLLAEITRGKAGPKGGLRKPFGS